MDERYLADYNVYAEQTRFQRKGVKGVDLSEAEQETLREWGIDPETINFEGTDLEKKVTNTDTLRRQWDEFMTTCIKDASGFNRNCFHYRPSLNQQQKKIKPLLKWK